METANLIDFDLGQIEDAGARSTIAHRRRELRDLFTVALAARTDPSVAHADIDRAALLTAMVEHSSERERSGTATYQDGVMASLAGAAARAREALRLPAGTYHEQGSR